MPTIYDIYINDLEGHSPVLYLTQRPCCHVSPLMPVNTQFLKILFEPALATVCFLH